MMMHKPTIYQDINGNRKYVKGNFVIKRNIISFNVNSYDKANTLIIDPALTVSTYLGGSLGRNAGMGISIPVNTLLPFVYITGYTSTTDFPTKNPYLSNNKNNGRGRTVFVLKYNRSTNSIVYSTYLGGTGGKDTGFSIATDTVGSAYVTSETNSKDFPLENPFQSTNMGARDYAAFVTKLNPEGNGLVYSTYLTGSGENQEGNGIAVDESGFAYITGETTSKDFPIKDDIQTENKGPKFTAYVTKLNTLGNALVFSTYLGGSGGQDGQWNSTL